MNSKLYISKENLKYNVDYIRSKIGSRRDIIAMVKANAYGAGDVLVAKELQDIGIKAFGVANINEALNLRNNNISGMILITSVITKEEMKTAILNNVSMSVSELENIKDINNVAKELGVIANVHIKLNTGMTRLGFEKETILDNIDEILSMENIKVQGIYTHLSCADCDENYTNSQIAEFNEIVKILSQKHEFEYIHILNSDGVQSYADKVDIDNYVRVGIVMYGYSNGAKPIFKLTAPVINIREIDEDTKVSYGGTFIARKGMKIAVVKIGYADGISRCLSNKITVNINGVECSQVGNICMDMMMVDVTNVDSVKLNDEAVIWDYDNNLEQIAKLSNKIVYEVISNLGTRIERVIE